MDNKENPSQEETVEVVVPAVQEIQAAEDPFTKGRERMDAIASTIASTKEKVASVATRIGGKISRFFSRAGKGAKTVAAALLSTDELAKKGANYVGNKIDEVAESGIEDLAKAEQWVSDKSSEIKQWTEQKVEKAKEIVHQGGEVAKDVAFAVQTKTNEAFNSAKEGIKNQYNNTVEFGENVLTKAKLGWAKGKEKFRDTYNSWALARLNARIEKDMQARERLLKVQGKVTLLADVDQLEVAA